MILSINKENPFSTKNEKRRKQKNFLTSISTTCELIQSDFIHGEQFNFNDTVLSNLYAYCFFNSKYKIFFLLQFNRPKDFEKINENKRSKWERVGKEKRRATIIRFTFILFHSEKSRQRNNFFLDSFKCIFSFLN